MQPLTWGGVYIRVKGQETWDPKHPFSPRYLRLLVEDWVLNQEEYLLDFRDNDVTLDCAGSLFRALLDPHHGVNSLGTNFFLSLANNIPWFWSFFGLGPYYL